MVGITSYGAHIPFHRLSRAEISRAWAGSQMPGERAVANFDEDSVTMAVAAAMECMKGISLQAIDGVFFATTTSPYKERLGASIIAAALDTRPDVRTMDITGTLRAGTSALGSAIDTVKAGTAKNVMVTAADCRIGAPAGDFEQAFGDAGAALLIGKDDVIANIVGSYTVSDEFSGVWRADGDIFVRSWEDRMVLDEGYSKLLPMAISGLIKKYDLAAKDLAKIVYDAPVDIRRHSMVGRKLGFNPSQIQDAMFTTVGLTGASMAMMMLAAALDEAKAGDKIVVASYGNGGDAFLIDVTPKIAHMRNRGDVKKQLASKRMLSNYETYLRWRGLLTIEAAKRPEIPATSMAALWRARKEILALYGVKCKKCGTPQYSSERSLFRAARARVCVVCRAKDEFEEYRFADKRATLFSFTNDNLAASPDPPTTTAVVDFEGGGRGIFEMTDRDPAQIEMGIPVEMTFRKLYYDRGIHNYYWKARPLRY